MKIGDVVIFKKDFPRSQIKTGHLGVVASLYYRSYGVLGISHKRKPYGSYSYFNKSTLEKVGKL